MENNVAYRKAKAMLPKDAEIVSIEQYDEEKLPTSVRKNPRLRVVYKIGSSVFRVNLSGFPRGALTKTQMALLED